ncbi:MAG: glycosyltransferase family 2 protein [Promethearchaeota archaeon]
MPAYFRHRKIYLNPNVPSDEEILSLLQKKHLKFPRFKFQITTRGKEVDVVKRSIHSVALLADASPLFEKHIELLIVTEEPLEKEIFSESFKSNGITFPAEVICVPKEYKTRNETLFKARSLQYSLEYRKADGHTSKNKKNSSYIFYFDAESTITETDFRRVIHSIVSSPEKRIFEGAIIYPHRYFDANIISRQMESVRPFNCHHCAQVMKNPPPLHLHGSNLLVEENLVNSIGWDFGKIYNQPLLAEDIIFGLKVYSKYGSQPFGWHGGRIYEQPPLSVRGSFQARLRWVTGTWQALSFMKNQPEYQDLPWRIRTKLQLRMRIRLIAHSLSFITVFFVLFSLFLFLFPSYFSIFDTHVAISEFRTLQYVVSRFILLPATIFWLFSILNGSSKNIEPLNLSKRGKLLEALKLLVVTPIAGVIDSFCAFYASLRWFLGKPYNSWNVTSK